MEASIVQVEACNTLEDWAKLRKSDILSQIREYISTCACKNEIVFEAYRSEAQLVNFST